MELAEQLVELAELFAELLTELLAELLAELTAGGLGCRLQIWLVVPVVQAH